MTAFQESCLTTLTSVYEDHGIRPHTETVKTRDSELMQSKPGDVYIRHVFEHQGHKFEVFVYVDEAGFFLDGAWHGFEREDFPTEEDIIAAVSGELRSSLNG